MSHNTLALPQRPSRHSPWLTRALLWLLLTFAFRVTPVHAEAASTNRWWPDSVEQALTQAGTNRQELAEALNQAPVSQREGLQFLLENMPERDLRTLSADFLLVNLMLAYQTRDAAPWAKSIPTEIFLNDVLPYASVTESRDNWRKTLGQSCAPLVEGCKTPGQAAQALNQKLFGLVKVKYSTQRRRADQGPFETIETGLASCTGLAILLVDACRSVGVPARVAGTPMWTNGRGNHTWVEIWDGDWHFAGAAEPDPNGLDRGWFAHDASLAVKDDREHAIYASSFKKTGLSFPLVWARRVDWVSAVNVTDRYTPQAKPVEVPKTRLLVKVLDRPSGQRVAAPVIVTEATNAAVKFEGTSRDESVDLNDILPFAVAQERAYAVRVQQDGRVVRREVLTGTNAEQLVVLCLSEAQPAAATSPTASAPQPGTPKLKPKDEAALKKALAEFFTAPADKQAAWKFAGSLEKLLRDNEPAVRRAAWEAYCAAPIHAGFKQDFDTNQVHFDTYLSPYTVKTVGTRPAKGWALFIAMHGGGGAPKQVNDSQWRVMQRYYRDHPESGGYRYVALRAPNDAWNGFYADYVYPLVANLIRQFLLFGDVDPDKVFIMGYSHGGYGAFAIGPKMPDRFAAIHASAAAPTDGETTPKTLRNTIFTSMVGEKDTMYGRFDRCRRFTEEIQKLRGERTDIYPVRVDVIPGAGHPGLPDRDKIADMYPAVRNPVPRELTWRMTDGVIRDFFWLHSAKPAKNLEFDALCRDNRLTVTAPTNAAASVLLDSRLVDFRKPVALELNGKRTSLKLRPSLRVLGETLQRRGDPELAFTAEVLLSLANERQNSATPSR